MPTPTQIISPAQALLLLIDHYKTIPSAKTKVDELKRLYLSGANSEHSRSQILMYLNSDEYWLGHKEYVIKFDADVINKDPSRRYFETHLSVRTIESNLNKMNATDLQSHVDHLGKLLPPKKFEELRPILAGVFPEGDDSFLKEFADGIGSIKTSSIYRNISDANKDKIILILQCAFLAVVNAKEKTPMPLDIYGQGFYGEGARGKVMLKDQDSTRSQNFGLMKSSMPMPLDDIARADATFKYMKPVDQSRFFLGADWIEYNFKQMVHPFSNSISGTMLCQLRAIAKQYQENESTNLPAFAHKVEDINLFIKLFVSALVLNAGGHTLNEFIAPLQLSETRSIFNYIPSFDTLNLETVFLAGNETSFDQALEETIIYNRQILAKAMTQEQLLSAQAEAKNPEALNYLHKQLERTKKINLIDQHLRIDPNLEDGLVNFLYLFYENKEQNQAVLQRFLIETPERKNQLLLMALNARNYELFGYLHQDPNFYGEIGSRLITEKKMTNRYWEMIINKVPLDWNILHDIINKQHLPLMSEIVENFLLKTLIHLKDNNLTEEYSSLFAVQDKQMIFVFIRGDSEPRKSASIQWFLERELSAKPNIDWECIHLLVKEHINGIGLSKVSTTKGILEILNTAQTTLKDGEQLKPYTAFYKSLTDFMTSLTQYRKLTPLALVKYNIVEFLTDKKTIPFNPPANYQALLRLSESLFNQAEALERSHPEINMSFLRPIIEAKLSDCEEATKKTPAPEKKFFSSASSKRAPVEGAVGEIEPVKEPRKTS